MAEPDRRPLVAILSSLICLVVLVWVLVELRRLRERLDECCSDTQGRLAQIAADIASIKQPGPTGGPIISVRPSSGGTAVQWRYGAEGSDSAAVPGNSMQLHVKYKGELDSFYGKVDSVKSPVTAFTITYADGKTLRIEKSGSTTTWTYSGGTFTDCDSDSGTATPDCSGHGLPPEIFANHSARVFTPVITGDPRMWMEFK